MRRVARWTLLTVAVLAVLLVAALAAVPRLVDTGRARALIAGAIAQSLGRSVSFASLSVAVLPLPSVVVTDLAVAEDPAYGPAPFIRLSRAQVRLRLWPLLLLRLELGDVVLEHPEVSLIQDDGGRWNVASLGPPAADPRRSGRGRRAGPAAGGAAALAGRVHVHDGIVSLERRSAHGRARYRLERLEAFARTAATGAIGFRGAATLMPGDLAIEVTDGSLAPGPGRHLLDATLGGRLAVRGAGMGALIAAATGPSLRVDGTLQAAFSLGGTLGKPRASGTVEVADPGLTRVSAACTEPKRRTLALGPLSATVVLDERRATVRPFTTSLGGGEITGALAATLGGGRVDLNELVVKRVPIERVLADFLCQNYAVTGPLDLRGAASAHAADPWRTVTGSGDVRIGPGRIVGARAVVLADAVLRLGGSASPGLRGQIPTMGPSPVDYEAITASYRIVDGVVSTRDLKLTSQPLEVSAAGTYALATGAVDLDAVARHAGGQIRARVTGTAESPSIRVVESSGLRGAVPDRLRGFEDLLRRFR